MLQLALQQRYHAQTRASPCYVVNNLTAACPSQKSAAARQAAPSSEFSLCSCHVANMIGTTLPEAADSTVYNSSQTDMLHTSLQRQVLAKHAPGILLRCLSCSATARSADTSQNSALSVVEQREASDCRQATSVQCQTKFERPQHQLDALTRQHTLSLRLPQAYACMPNHGHHEGSCTSHCQVTHAVAGCLCLPFC
jgi:hypothetical protein